MHDMFRAGYAMYVCMQYVLYGKIDFHRDSASVWAVCFFSILMKPYATSTATSLAKRMPAPRLTGMGRNVLVIPPAA